MNATETLHTGDLTRRLAEAEATIEALLSGQIDAVVDSKSKTPVLLSKAQEALRASEERYRRIVETTDEGIATIDTHSTFTFVNRRLAEMLGYAVDEMVGESTFMFMPVAAEETDAHRLRVERSPEGDSGEAEVRLVRRDGSELWALVRTSPIRDGAGMYIGTLAMVIDRTRRRQDREALKESEARFGRLAESGLIGVMIADMHGNIFEANDAYLKMIGYSREELVQGAVRWADLTPPELAHLGARAAEQLQATGVAPSWETESFRKDGSRIPLLIGVALLEYPKCIAFAVDLSERETTAKALRVVETQLRQAQKMEAVGRLAGGIAHDFNNMLSVILSYGEMILADLKPGDPLRHDIEEMHEAGTRAADLTRQLLMFSRQQVIEPRVLDLDAVLSGMDRMLQRLVGEDVELVSIAGASVGRVHVDPGSIEQVIMNLVVNARDAMPRGGKLTMETANVVLDEGYASTHLGAKPGSYVMLAVTDSGTGMGAATVARIFEPFFTTKEVGKGTGLGLSTVFGIVQQSGGSVGVYSEPGLGTTFKVYLPRVDALADAPSLPRDPTTLRGTETVLLVEDEEQVRHAALGILRRHGYAVIEARSAGDALLLCENHAGPIHLLLSDVVMPGMSGPELAKRLAHARPEMKVLCMSGYTDDAAVRHGVIDAAFAYLQKPLTVETLTRKVREVLDSARSAH